MVRIIDTENNIIRISSIGNSRKSVSEYEQCKKQLIPYLQQIDNVLQEKNPKQ
jgi:hypothetical protein